MNNSKRYGNINVMLAAATHPSVMQVFVAVFKCCSCLRTHGAEPCLTARRGKKIEQCRLHNAIYGTVQCRVTLLEVPLSRLVKATKEVIAALKCNVLTGLFKSALVALVKSKIKDEI